ncbi:caspase, EACC1-associated type [Streptomyces sp. SGAir0957]
MTDLSGSGVRVLLLATAAHDGPDLPAVPAVESSFEALRNALRERCGVRDGALHAVLNPPDAQTMAIAVTEAAQQAGTVLLVYFIGHGLLGPDDELYLAASGTGRLVPGMADHQALSFSSLRQALAVSPASSVVVVLDCCFSGWASLSGGGPVAPAFALAPAHGLYLIGSAEQLALAPPGADRTAFTGAFLELLEDGDPRGPHQLTLDSVYDTVFQKLRDQNRPWPRRQAGDRSGNLVIAPNPAAPAAPRPQGPRDPAPGRCPYPGLDAFGTDDADVFFGREQMTGRLLPTVAEACAADAAAPGLLALVGASGSGKTSLLNAGLLAAVRARGLPGLPGSEGWPCVRLTPGSNPLRRLAGQLDAAPQDGADRLRADPGHARALIARMLADRPGARLIILVDQLEELFTLCPDAAERTAFLRAVTAAAGGDGEAPPRTLAVLALRADFYGRAAEHPELLTVLRERQVLVEPMTPKELLACIERPAGAVGLVLDDGLADVMLHELGASSDGRPAAGALPLLSHALWATWWECAGARLTVAGYRATGGIARAIATTAEQVYGSLDEAGRKAVRRMLPRLVRVGEDASDTARPVERAELLHGLANPGAAQQAIDRFAEARLLTLDRDTVRISHEALLREWPDLRKWLNADRDSLHAVQQLTDDALAWERSGRDASLLYRGTRLAAMRARAEQAPSGTAGLPPSARAFLATADRTVRRQLWQRRAVSIVLVLLTVAAGIAARTAMSNADAAAAQERHVRAQHALALSRQLASQSLVVERSDPLRARRLAVAAWHVSRTDQAGTAMSTLLTGQQQDGMLIGHDTEVEALAFNPAGTLLASVDGLQLRLWNPATGQQVGAPVTQGFDGLTNAVAFSPDGRSLATASNDGTVQLFDTATHHRVRRAVRERGADSAGGRAAVAFSPDGSLLASTHGATVLLWDTHDLRQVGAPIKAAAKDGMATSVVFAPRGRTLVTAAKDGTVRFWDPATHRETGTAITATKDRLFGVVGLAFNPKGTLLATACGDGTARLWDPVTQRAVGRPFVAQPDGSKVSAAVFSASGKSLITLSNGVVRLWSVATGHDLGRAIPLPDAGSATGLALDPAGTVLAVAGGDNTVRLFNPATRKPLGAPVTAASFGYQGTAVAFDPAGTVLATGDSKGTVRLWDPRTQQPRGDPFEATTEYAVNALTFSPDGRLLVTAGQDGTVGFWDPVTRRKSGRFLRIPATYGTQGVYNAVEVAFNPKGTVLATGNGDGTVRLWDSRTREQIGRPIVANPFSAETPRYSAVHDLAFSPDGTVLATAGADGVVRLWNTATRRQVGADIRHGSGASAHDAHDLAFTADGRALATAGEDGTVRLWNPSTQRQTGRPLTMPVPKSDRQVDAVAFSPDGSLLVTVSGGQTVRFWNPRTRHEVGLPIPVTTSGQVWDMAVSPDGHTLATVQNSGTAQLWRIDQWTDPYRTLCAEAGPITQEDWTKYAPGEPLPYVCT